MRFVSLNAWGGREWQALSAWAPQVGADIFCLQEMIRAPVPSPEWLEYADAARVLPQRADLFGDMSALLPDHAAYFAAAARGPLTDPQGRVFVSEHGLGAWVARDLAVAGLWQGFVHGAFRLDGWGPEPVPRTMQLFRILAPSGGSSVVLGHLHGIRLPSGKGDSPERTGQAKALVAALTAFRHQDEPCILAGDFNLLPDSATFEALRAIGLHDLVTGRGIADTRTALYRKPQRHANYMLVSDGIRVTGFDVPATPEVSDHRPLILDFDF